MQRIIFSLASSVISLQYQLFTNRFGSVWIPIAFGRVNRCKSAAAKLAVAACGNPKSVYTDVTLAVLKDLLKGGVPFVYDDPSNTTFLRTLLIDAFGGAEMGTRHNQFSARCVPLVTVNEFILDALADSESR